ncbi:hypothetical protein ACFWN1_16255 [Streptomyces sp. NPDC058459]|uniref:hypothetical protein n=1 Tax=Streptomyces sp. NPDC058459 TaxID=3346508 RepID=UPI003653363B
MDAEETSRFVRLRVELVLEVLDGDELTKAALRRIAADPELPDAERAHAGGDVTEDTAEALAYLVDPFDLVSDVPGVELQQASWSGERFAYDPDSPKWDFGDDDEDDDEPADDVDGRDER